MGCNSKTMLISLIPVCNDGDKILWSPGNSMACYNESILSLLR